MCVCNRQKLEKEGTEYVEILRIHADEFIEKCEYVLSAICRYYGKEYLKFFHLKSLTRRVA